MTSSSRREGLEKLAQRMARNEDAAFKEFAEFFGTRLKSFFVWKAKTLTETEAEDLAASCVTAVALKVKGGSYCPTKAGNFQAWVYGCAYNALIDWLRKRQVLESLPEDVELQDVFCSESEPNMDIVLAVDEALQELSEPDRTVVEMRDLGIEHTYEEISKCVNLRPGTVRQRHKRALEKLEAILKNDPRIQSHLERGEKRRAKKRGETDEEDNG